MAIQELTIENWQTEVEGEHPLIVVDFYADWCGPCRILSPTMEQISKEFDPEKVKFFKINVDTNRDIANRYGIRSIPCLVFFKGGKELGKSIGAQPKDNIQREIEKYL